MASLRDYGRVGEPRTLLGRREAAPQLSARSIGLPLQWPLDSTGFFPGGSSAVFSGTSDRHHTVGNLAIARGPLPRDRPLEPRGASAPRGGGGVFFAQGRFHGRPSGMYRRFGGESATEAPGSLARKAQFRAQVRAGWSTSRTALRTALRSVETARSSGETQESTACTAVRADLLCMCVRMRVSVEFPVRRGT